MSPVMRIATSTGTTTTCSWMTTKIATATRISSPTIGHDQAPAMRTASGTARATASSASSEESERLAIPRF